MAFDFSSFKRLARIFLIGSMLGVVAAPALAAQAGPLQYQSARGSNGADSGDGNPCDPRSGHRRDGQGMSAYCDAQPKFSQHGNDNARRPASSAFGLQFDAEGY
jgi:hypothetical protein